MEAYRGLIIKECWLNKMFNDGKVWEIRGSQTKIRGKIFLIQSRSRLIVGECEIIDCIKLDKNLFEANKKFHTIEKKYEELNYSCPYAWIINPRSVRKYDIPVTYPRHNGAVIWVDLAKDKDVVEQLCNK